MIMVRKSNFLLLAWPMPLFVDPVIFLILTEFPTGPHARTYPQPNVQGSHRLRILRRQGHEARQLVQVPPPMPPAELQQRGVRQVHRLQPPTCTCDPPCCRLCKEKEQQNESNPHLPRRRGRRISAPPAAPRKRGRAEASGAETPPGSQPGSEDDSDSASQPSEDEEESAHRDSVDALQATLATLTDIKKDPALLQQRKYQPIKELLQVLDLHGTDLQVELPLGHGPLRCATCMCCPYVVVFVCFLGLHSACTHACAILMHATQHETYFIREQDERRL
jgi:hypothetical protein